MLQVLVYGSVNRQSSALKEEITNKYKNIWFLARPTLKKINNHGDVPCNERTRVANGSCPNSCLTICERPASSFTAPCPPNPAGGRAPVTLLRLRLQGVAAATTETRTANTVAPGYDTRSEEGPSIPEGPPSAGGASSVSAAAVAARGPHTCERGRPGLRCEALLPELPLP